MQRRRALGLLSAAAAAAGCSAPPAGDDGAAGHTLAAEFDPVSALWLSYDAGHVALTAALVDFFRGHVALRFVVPDASRAAMLRALLQDKGVAPAEVTVEPASSFFLRDLAVFTRGPTGGVGLVDFRWSAYGTAAWCRQRHGADAAAAAACSAATSLERDAFERRLARTLGARVHTSAIAVEGGGVETNGRGLLLATESLYLSRNPGLGRAAIEAGLLRLPGVARVIWLPEGLAEDAHLRATITGDHVAWGTGGHSDEYVRFSDENTVLLAWPDDGDVASHPVSRLTRQRMQRNLEILLAAQDLRGRPLRVLKVPMPRPIERRIHLSAAAHTEWSAEWTADFFPPAERRWQGQRVWQVATASYLNYVLANGRLLLPDYLPHGTPPERQQRVRRVFEQAFPGREIGFADAISANWVGGGMHCATLTQP
jgi:agmatine deiminase